MESERVRIVDIAEELGLIIGVLSGLSQAAGIITGKSLGSGAFEKAYREAKNLMMYGLMGSAYIMWIDFIGTWIFGVPLGMLAAFVWKLQIPGQSVSKLRYS